MNISTKTLTKVLYMSYSSLSNTAITSTSASKLAVYMNNTIVLGYACLFW